MTKYIKFQNSVNSRRSSLVAPIPPDLFHSCTVMFICTDRNDRNCKWLWQLLLSRAGCIMFLTRQIYLAQIYGIMIAATLTACALTGTFVTCYTDIAHHRLLCSHMDFFFLIHNRAGCEGGTITSRSFVAWQPGPPIHFWPPTRARDQSRFIAVDLRLIKVSPALDQLVLCNLMDNLLWPPCIISS